MGTTARTVAWLYAASCLGLLLLLGLHGAGTPRAATAATEQPVVVVEFPPFPTQVPYPTQIPYPTVVSQQGTTGLAAVMVGTGEGSQGPIYLIAAICLFGFTVLALLKFAELAILRRG